MDEDPGRKAILEDFEKLIKEFLAMFFKRMQSKTYNIHCRLDYIV